MNRIEDYRPSEHEEYMSSPQLEYFERLLQRKKADLISTTTSAREELKESWLRGPDLFDVATSHADMALDIEDLARQRLNLSKIERALSKIKSGDYGYCELSGEKIGLQRLMAQPVATLCVEVQESMERAGRRQRVTPGVGEMTYSFA